MSPSSRRAWIEIDLVLNGHGWSVVALLTEGVDRNNPPDGGFAAPRVALLTEGVDRNFDVYCIFKSNVGRPPHGGRG